MNWILSAVLWVGKKLSSNSEAKVIEAQTKVWEELLQRKDEIIKEYQQIKTISNGEKDELIRRMKEEESVLKMLQQRYNKVVSENQKLKEEKIFLMRNKKRSMYE